MKAQNDLLQKSKPKGDTMRLSEDREVVDELKRILEDYDCLAYDEVWSENRDILRVTVTKNVDRDSSFARQITKRLEQATGRIFYPSGFFTTGSADPDKDWDGFTIRMKR